MARNAFSWRSGTAENSEASDGVCCGRRARRPRAVAVLGDPAQHRVQRGDVLGRGAAAAADDVDAVLGDEALEPGGELVGAERIMGVAAAQLGQAGIGQAARSGRARSGDRCRTCSAISLGPVAQLRPMTGTPSASMIAVAAAMSAPTSMVPVVSMVTCDHQRQLARRGGRRRAGSR